MHKAKRSVVGFVTSLRAGQSGVVVQFQEWAGIYLYPKAFSLTLGLRSLLLSCYRGNVTRFR
jgi:hypothetical protein